MGTRYEGGTECHSPQPDSEKASLARVWAVRFAYRYKKYFNYFKNKKILSLITGRIHTRPVF